MPVIAFASSKGGAGKTTSAIILATEFAQHVDVALIDADPAARLTKWAGRGTLPARLSVLTCAREKEIQDNIAEARRRAPYVILDLEGTASNLNSYILAESDLVVVPMGDEQQDAEDAIETLAQVQQIARMTRRTIPAAVLFCRTKAAVKSKLAKALNAQMREDTTAFQIELHDRTAFSCLHNYGGDLRSLDPDEVGGLDKAIENADAFARELIDILEEMREAHDAKSA